MKPTIALLIIIGLAAATGLGYHLYKPTLELKRVVALAESLHIASQNHQYDAVWISMYPDDQIYWESKDSYVALLKERDDYLARMFSVKGSKVLENVRKVEKWTSPITKRTYWDVYEVPIETTTLRDGEEEIDRSLYYYKFFAGTPRYFTAVSRDELEESLSALRQLFD